MSHKPPSDFRVATGLALSRETLLPYWLSYFALLASFLGLIFVELGLRLDSHLGFYFFEAVLALCAPMAVLALCDHLSLRAYEEVWHDLRFLNRAPLLLDRNAVDQIRSELRWNLLLLGLRPPASKDMRAQLFTAALWYRALLQPEGRPWPLRYAEQLGWSVALALTLLLPLGWLLVFTAEAPWLREASLLGLFLVALSIGALGAQQLVVLARRLAIQDYFQLTLLPTQEEG